MGFPRGINNLKRNATTDIELSRRHVLAGIGAVGLTSAGAGLGTTAYFSDSESFDGNTLTAGQLDLSVTWQQLYFGAPQSVRPGDYGEAERPFVNAYPNSDGNGLQSFERGSGTDEYVDLEAHDDPEVAAKAGRNLEFTCEEIATFEAPSFAPNRHSLIELEDVKPGDCGELTFGLKLCDNSGYIWLHGVLGEETDGEHPESDGAQLADAIVARVWYDDGDNVYQEGEPLIALGSLREVLEDLASGRLLAFDPGAVLKDPEPPEEGDTETLFSEDCEVIQGNPTCADLGLFRAIKVESEDLPTAVGEAATYETDVGEVTITVRGVSDDDVREFDFLLEGFEASAVIVKGGPVANVCRKLDDGGNALTVGRGVELGAPINPSNEQRYGVSHVSFCYEPVIDEPEPEPENGEVCFQPSITRFIGFEWCLPPTVGNEVQGDGVAFDLSFYTEQCRHNPDPENPFADDAA